MRKEDLTHRIDNLSAEGKLLFYNEIRQLLDTRSSEGLSGNKRLVAYVQGRDGFDQNGLRSHLGQDLPDYMVPSSFIAIDEIPTLPNGKINRTALSELKVKDPKEQKAIDDPTTDTEDKMVAIWEEVLNFSPINVNDNFFEIGGDSILSIQIIAKARKMGMTISPNQLFEHQTIRELATDISAKVDQDIQFDFLVPLRKKGNKKPLFCVHSGGGHVFFYNLLTEYMEQGRPIYALQPSGLDGAKEDMHSTIEEMTKDYVKAMRAIQPIGPYNVLVYCFSATVGNEMAVQLAKENHDINIIVMDTMASPWTLNKPGRLEARLRSFVIRFFKSPVLSIKTFFIDRFWRISPMWVKLFGNENQKELESLKINLRKICLAYEWKKHPGKVSLILSEKPHESLQNVTIESWKELAQGGVELFYTKGNHRTLFEEPDVRYVSEKIDEAMIE